MSQTDPNVLVSKEYPWVLWLSGGLFAVSGLVFLFIPGSLTGGLISLAVGLGVGLLGPVNTLTLDRRRNRFSLRRRTLWRATVQEYPLDAIRSFELESSQSIDSGNTYRIIAVLAEGGQAPLTSAFTSGQRRKARRVEQLNQWLAPTPAQLARQALFTDQPAPPEAPYGETAGVHWQIQARRAGEAPVTRWFSPDTKFTAGFLLLAQKPEGMRTPGKLLGSLGRMFGQQALSLYGFSAQDCPGIETSAPLEPPEPRLEPYYIILTSNPLAARQVLNAWAIPPLVAWAERNPLQADAAPQSSQGQLVVLFSPQGVYLAALSAQGSLDQEALTSLGVDLVRAQGGAA